MATSSFDKAFIVKDSSTMKRIHKQFESGNTIKIVKKDIKVESSKGVALLKLSL